MRNLILAALAGVVVGALLTGAILPRHTTVNTGNGWVYVVDKFTGGAVLLDGSEGTVVRYHK